MSFSDDHRGTPLDNAEENVVVAGPLKRDVEPETVAIKRECGGDILDDEERRNTGNFWFSHVSFHPRNLPLCWCPVTLLNSFRAGTSCLSLALN